MRAVFFDLDGTLLQYTRDYRDLLVDAFRDAGADPPQAALEAYESSFRKRFRALDPQPVRRALESRGLAVDADAFAAALLEQEIQATRPPEGAADALERLSSSARLGVLTNGLVNWQRRKLAATDVARFFDAVVASYKAGAHKPDHAPFQLAEDRLPADRYEMVGDADADVDGAEAAGWTAHRYEGGDFVDLIDAIARDD